MLISLAFLITTSNITDPFFPGYAPLPNPTPKDRVIIVIPKQPKVEWSKERTA